MSEVTIDIGVFGAKGDALHARWLKKQWLRERAARGAATALLRMPKYAKWRFRIRCSGTLHRVVLSRDRVELPDHDFAIEQAAWALGAKPVSPCLVLAARAAMLRPAAALFEGRSQVDVDAAIAAEADRLKMPGRLARCFELGAWARLCNADEARRAQRRKRR